MTAAAESNPDSYKTIIESLPGSTRGHSTDSKGKMSKLCTADEAVDVVMVTNRPIARIMKHKDWLPYKEQIQRLYLEESLTLREVKKTLEKEHGLKVTYVDVLGQFLHLRRH